MALAEGGSGGKATGVLPSYDEYLAQQYSGGYGPAPVPAGPPPAPAPAPEPQPIPQPEPKYILPPSEQDYINSLNIVSQYNQDNVYSTGNQEAAAAWDTPEPYEVPWTPTDAQLAEAKNIELDMKMNSYYDAKRAPYRVQGNSLLSDQRYDQHNVVWGTSPSPIPAAIAANPTLLPPTTRYETISTYQYPPVEGQSGILNPRNRQFGELTDGSGYMMYRIPDTKPNYDTGFGGLPELNDVQPLTEKQLIKYMVGLYGGFRGGWNGDIYGPQMYMDNFIPKSYQTGPYDSVYSVTAVDPSTDEVYRGPLADNQRPGFGYLADAGQHYDGGFVSSGLGEVSGTPTIEIVPQQWGYFPIEQRFAYEDILKNYTLRPKPVRPTLEDQARARGWEPEWERWWRDWQHQQNGQITVPYIPSGG